MTPESKRTGILAPVVCLRHETVQDPDGEANFCVACWAENEFNFDPTLEDDDDPCCE